jgi:hypothetical protein
MAHSISLKEHKFVLEADRSIDDDLKTLFFIKPMTVKDSSESAARYAGVSKTNRRKNRNEVDSKAYQDAENQDWLRSVLRVQNFLVVDHSPGNAYTYFEGKAKETPDVYKVEQVDFQEGNGVEPVIRVVEATSENDRLKIFHAMDVSDTEEIFKAISNYTELTVGEKNS